MPTLAPRLKCAWLLVLLSMLDRWRRPWRRSLSRHSSAQCLAHQFSCALRLSPVWELSPGQHVRPPIQGLFIPVQDSSSPSSSPSVVAQSLDSMMPTPSTSQVRTNASRFEYLMETLCPFQLFYRNSMDLEWLGAESARELVRCLVRLIGVGCSFNS